MISGLKIVIKTYDLTYLTGYNSMLGRLHNTKIISNLHAFSLDNGISKRGFYETGLFFTDIFIRF